MEEDEKKGMIVFTKYSPFSVVDVVIENYEGEEYNTPRVVSLCRCGKSKNKPFCDGTHGTIDFNNEREEEKLRGLKTYECDKITVYYDKYLCKHIGKCTHGYPEVFNADKIPWIEPKSANNLDKLIEVIKKCPSGALSYKLEDGSRETVYHSEQKIKIEKNGSINITGGISLIDDNKSDVILDSKEHYSLCRCGASKHKPFCDGTHIKIEFDGQK
ncbi:MAG: CDGSH iron-sulfur domain-containing protein [Sebaldella sp.]|nr:CDGSH iron-sulfur domain-containing protein [Sebaldella sp.]